MSPLVSIVTPSYNQGEFIESTIQSVLNQDYSNLEYIVMDGGSTDRTLKILKKYSNHLKWESKSDRGQAHAINKGLQQASGEILAYLNSDDIYLPNAISKAVKTFEENPDIAMIYGQAYYIDADGNKIKDYPTEPFDINRLAENCFICQPSVFIRKEALHTIGYFDEAIQCSMDYDAWIRLAKKKFKIETINNYLACSRLHDDIKTFQLRRQVIKENMSIVKKHYGYIGREWYLTLYQYYINDVWNGTSLAHQLMRDFWETVHEYHQNSRSKYPTYHYNPIGMCRYFLRKHRRLFLNGVAQK